MSQMNPVLSDDVMSHVNEVKQELTYRCMNIMLALQEHELFHCVLDDHIYVMANPIVTRTDVYDDEGNVIGVHTVPNIHAEYHYTNTSRQMAHYDTTSMYVTLDIPTPRVIVMIPSLIIRLNLDGTLDVDGKDTHLNLDDTFHTMNYNYADMLQKQMLAWFDRDKQ